MSDFERWKAEYRPSPSAPDPTFQKIIGPQVYVIRKTVDHLEHKYTRSVKELEKNPSSKKAKKDLLWMQSIMDERIDRFKSFMDMDPRVEDLHKRMVGLKEAVNKYIDEKLNKGETPSPTRQGKKASCSMQ